MLASFSTGQPQRPANPVPPLEREKSKICPEQTDIQVPTGEGACATGQGEQMNDTEDVAMDTNNECDVREMIAATRPLLDGNMHESAETAEALALQNPSPMGEPDQWKQN
jgi:hypothetical protein